MPLLDPANSVIASVTLAGPQKVMDAGTVARLLTELERAAVKIKQELGLLAAGGLGRQ